jgi:hypothetical protein
MLLKNENPLDHIGTCFPPISSVSKDRDFEKLHDLEKNTALEIKGAKESYSSKGYDIRFFITHRTRNSRTSGKIYRMACTRENQE